MKRKQLWFLLFAIVMTGCNKGKTPFTSKWPTEIAQKLESSIGYDIPYIEATDYISYVTEDDFGDPMMVIQCVYDLQSDSENAIVRYANVCQEEGYAVEFTTQRVWDPTQLSYIEYEVYYADKQMSDTLGVEIQFLLGGNSNVEQLGIFAYTYPIVDEKSWPTNLVTSFLGYDVPHYEEEGATYAATLELDSDNTPYVYIRITGVNSEAEERYKTILTEKKYTIVDDNYNEGYGYYAFAKDQSHCVQFGYTENYGLEIFIWKITKSAS